MTQKPQEYKNYQVHFTVSFKTWFNVRARSQAEAEREAFKNATAYYQRNLVRDAVVTITKRKK